VFGIEVTHDDDLVGMGSTPVDRRWRVESGLFCWTA
jgi:hypothetical protein